MAKELLTAHKVRAITKAGVYKDGGGLRLIVTARGTKRWELWISINGKKRELGSVFSRGQSEGRARRGGKAEAGGSRWHRSANAAGPSRGARTHISPSL